MKNNEDYPINLLDDLTSGPTDTPHWEHDLPPDLIPSVEYAIALLTEREAKIIHMYYQYDMTHRQIAKEFCLTEERIRQIKVRAIRKLSHPSRLKWVINGVQGEIAKHVQQAQEHVICNELKTAISNIAKIAESLPTMTDDEIIRHAAAENNLDTPISELDLSVRSFNCLKRRGIYTLRDLTSLTVDELMETRNLGKRSFEEIIEKVHEYGLEFRKDKNNA